MRSCFVEHERVTLDFVVDDGQTKQEFAEDCDVNAILKRFEKTGIIDHVSRIDGKYGDFTAAVDYHTALNMVQEAGEMFMSLPASIRAEFENDPGLFLDYATDPENEDGMRELGLLPVERPVRVSVEPQGEEGAEGPAGEPAATSEAPAEPEKAQ